MPVVPRQQRLRESDKKRIERVLSMLSRHAPHIRIEPMDSLGFEIVYNPLTESSIPPIPGSQGFYVDYEAVSHEFLEATAEWYARSTRARHVRCIEYAEAGGSRIDDGFQLCWFAALTYLHHFSRHKASALNWLTGRLGPASTRLISPELQLRWLRGSDCTGPKEGGVFCGGWAKVSIGNNAFDCVRVIDVSPAARDTDDCPSEPGEPVPEWDWLDDTYLAFDGRVVLTRRMMSAEEQASQLWTRERYGLGRIESELSEWSKGRARIDYNGISFWHCLDILTDVSLGWPAPPPIRVRQKSGKGTA